MIKVIDYGLGNIQAFQNIYRRMNIEIGVARAPQDLVGATKLILPGVGAFDNAMDLLNRSGMRAVLQDLVLGSGVPVLGVCVGMQMLAEGSDEGRLPGLGWLKGRVHHLSTLQQGPMQIPHMGWNDVVARPQASLFRHLESGSRFYFLHSYYFECGQPGDQAAVSIYGREFCCAVQKTNVYGVQFHPEKSHQFGAQLLRNFAEIPSA